MKENIKYSFLNRIVNALVPFIISMYLARVLSRNDLGDIAYGKNILTYFLVIAMMGIQDYGIREIAKSKNDCRNESQIFMELVVINSISTTIALLLYVYFQIKNPDRIIRSFVVIIIANYFNFDFLLIGREKYKFVALRNITQKLVFIPLVFAFVRTNRDVNNYIYLYALSQFVLHIPDILYALKSVKASNIKIHIFRHLKSILLLFGTAISLELYSQIDITMLGFWCTSSDIAIYSYSSKFVKMIVVLICSISTVLLPRISYLNDKEKISEHVKLILELVLLMALPAMIGGYIVSYDVMVFLYGNNFYEAGKIVKILVLLIIICSTGNIFGTQVLVSQHKERELLLSTVVGAFTNIGFNYFFIRRSGVEGAAIASLLSEFLVMLLQYYFSRKVVSVKIEKDYWRRLFLSVLLFSLSLIPLELCDAFKVHYRLFFQLFVGMVVYGFCLKIFFKNQFFKNIGT